MLGLMLANKAFVCIALSNIYLSFYFHLNTSSLITLYSMNLYIVRLDTYVLELIVYLNVSVLFYFTEVRRVGEGERVKIMYPTSPLELAPFTHIAMDPISDLGWPVILPHTFGHQPPLETDWMTSSDLIPGWLVSGFKWKLKGSLMLIENDEFWVPRGNYSESLVSIHIILTFLVVI